MKKFTFMSKIGREYDEYDKINHIIILANNIEKAWQIFDKQVKLNTEIGWNGGENYFYYCHKNWWVLEEIFEIIEEVLFMD